MIASSAKDIHKNAGSPGPSSSPPKRVAPTPLKRDMSRSHFGSSRSNLFDAASIIQNASEVHKRARKSSAETDAGYDGDEDSSVPHVVEHASNGKFERKLSMSHFLLGIEGKNGKDIMKAVHSSSADQVNDDLHVATRVTPPKYERKLSMSQFLLGIEGKGGKEIMQAVRRTSNESSQPEQIAGFVEVTRPPRRKSNASSQSEQIVDGGSDLAGSNTSIETRFGRKMSMTHFLLDIGGTDNVSMDDEASSSSSEDELDVGNTKPVAGSDLSRKMSVSNFLLSVEGKGSDAIMQAVRRESAPAPCHGKSESTSAEDDDIGCIVKGRRDSTEDFLQAVQKDRKKSSFARKNSVLDFLTGIEGSTAVEKSNAIRGLDDVRSDSSDEVCVGLTGSPLATHDSFALGATNVYDDTRGYSSDSDSSEGDILGFDDRGTSGGNEPFSRRESVSQFLLDVGGASSSKEKQRVITKTSFTALADVSAPCMKRTGSMIEFLEGLESASPEERRLSIKTAVIDSAEGTYTSLSAVGTEIGSPVHHDAAQMEQQPSFTDVNEAQEGRNSKFEFRKRQASVSHFLLSIEDGSTDIQRKLSSYVGDNDDGSRSSADSIDGCDGETGASPQQRKGSEFNFMKRKDSVSQFLLHIDGSSSESENEDDGIGAGTSQGAPSAQSPFAFRKRQESVSQFLLGVQSPKSDSSDNCTSEDDNDNDIGVSSDSKQQQAQRKGSAFQFGKRQESVSHFLLNVEPQESVSAGTKRQSLKTADSFQFGKRQESVSHFLLNVGDEDGNDGSSDDNVRTLKRKISFLGAVDPEEMDDGIGGHYDEKGSFDAPAVEQQSRPIDDAFTFRKRQASVSHFLMSLDDADSLLHHVASFSNLHSNESSDEESADDPAENISTSDPGKEDELSIDPSDGNIQSKTEIDPGLDQSPEKEMPECVPQSASVDNIAETIASPPFGETVPSPVEQLPSARERAESFEVGSPVSEALLDLSTDIDNVRDTSPSTKDQAPTSREFRVVDLNSLFEANVADYPRRNNNPVDAYTRVLKSPRSSRSTSSEDGRLHRGVQISAKISYRDPNLLFSASSAGDDGFARITYPEPISFRRSRPIIHSIASRKARAGKSIKAKGEDALKRHPRGNVAKIGLELLGTQAAQTDVGRDAGRFMPLSSPQRKFISPRNPSPKFGQEFVEKFLKRASAQQCTLGPTIPSKQTVRPSPPRGDRGHNKIAYNTERFFRSPDARPGRSLRPIRTEIQ